MTGGTEKGGLCNLLINIQFVAVGFAIALPTLRSNRWVSLSRNPLYAR